MFLDASAIVAILNQEADAGALVDCIERATTSPIVSPLVRFEAVLALAKARAGGKKPSPEAIAQAALSVQLFLQAVDAEEMPITGEIGRTAVAASARYGKVVGHPAALNFGDCFAYACAMDRVVPLLFNGEDFSQTDVVPALGRDG